MRPRRLVNPFRASIFLEKTDIQELDRIRVSHGTSRNAILRLAIGQFIAQQKAA